MPPSVLPAPPLRDVLDDEEVLAGPDVAERPRFLHEHGEGRGPPELPLELGVLLLELPHRRGPDRALGARVDEVMQWPVVEEPDEEEGSNREPATGDGPAEAAPAFLPGSGHAAPSSAAAVEVLRWRP